MKTKIKLETKESTFTERLRSFAELKVEIDNKLQQELAQRAAEYEAAKRVELGLA